MFTLQDSSPVGSSQLKYSKGGKMAIFLCFVDIVYQKTFKIVPNTLRNDPYRLPHFGQNTENGRIFFNSVKEVKVHKIFFKNH